MRLHVVEVVTPQEVTIVGSMAVLAEQRIGRSIVCSVLTAMATAEWESYSNRGVAQFG